MTCTTIFFVYTITAQYGARISFGWSPRADTTTTTTTTKIIIIIIPRMPRYLSIFPLVFYHDQRTYVRVGGVSSLHIYSMCTLCGKGFWVRVQQQVLRFQVVIVDHDQHTCSGGLWIVISSNVCTLYRMFQVSSAGIRRY